MSEKKKTAKKAEIPVSTLVSKEKFEASPRQRSLAPGTLPDRGSEQS